MSKRNTIAVLAPYLVGFSLGFLVRSSWLNALSVLVGFVLVVVYLAIRIPIDRRRKMNAFRPKAEAMLDAMIALAENPPQPLEKTVIFNGSGRERPDRTSYHLQLRAEDGLTLSLRTSTLEKGRRAGWANVELGVHRGAQRIERLEYPDFADTAPQEAWLIVRLAKLRMLVGDVSLYESRKQLLKRHGIDIDKLKEPDAPPEA